MRGQRGQTSAEYLGMLLVVSVVVAAIATTDIGSTIRGEMSRQVCKIAGGDCGAAQAGRGGRVRTAGAARRLASAAGPTAHAANIPCDGMTPRECTALRAAINRAQAEHRRARDEYIRYAATFADWVARVERVADVRDVIYRPNLFKAINTYLRKRVNREGARLLTSVRNRKLWNIVRSNYRYGARIGKGSTADALRDEVARGVRYGAPKSHYIKAQDTINGLNNVLTRERLTARERQIATNIRGELWSALPPRYRPPLK